MPKPEIGKCRRGAQNAACACGIGGWVWLNYRPGSPAKQPHYLRWGDIVKESQRARRPAKEA